MRTPRPRHARSKSLARALESVAAQRKSWTESESSLLCRELARLEHDAGMSNAAKCLKIAARLPEKLAIDAAVRVRQLQQAYRATLSDSSRAQVRSGKSIQVPLQAPSSSNRCFQTASKRLSGVASQQTDQILAVCDVNEKLLSEAESYLTTGDTRHVETLAKVSKNLLWLDSEMKQITTLWRNMPRIPVRVDIRMKTTLSSRANHLH